MPLYVNYNSTRPNRLEDKKDKKYHCDFARWTLAAMQSEEHRRFISKCLINWSFYKGGDGQWIFEEDTENFFLDESGDIRNRLKITKNLIKPMVQQYIGNAVRLSYKARARAVSEFIINKREQGLKRLDFLHDMKENEPETAGVIEDKFGITTSREESKAIFENVFADKYEKDVNNLLRWQEANIGIDDIKIHLAKYLALNGVGVFYGYEQNGFYRAEAQDPMYWWFDRSAVKSDLSDAEFMGRWYYMDTPSLFEKYQKLTKEERKAIENHSQNGANDVSRMIDRYYQENGSRIPVYESYWKDVEEVYYGWVEDEYGYPLFTKIGKDTDYTDADLIEPPTDSHKSLSDGKKKVKIFVDVLRYAVFIPKEEVGTMMSGSEDIVLEWGEVPYQEVYKFDPSSVNFPFKCYAWSYDKGEILTPLDDAIDPQRFINRLLSVAESHINNSRGSGSVIAKNAVDPRDGEEGIIRAINKSKPVFVDTTRTGSVQNSVGTYGSNIGGDTMGLFNIMQQMQIGIQDVTGVNEAMVGSQGSSDALVGVIQSQIQRGTLIQEPFYYALTNILGQAYNHMATIGKKIHVDNPRRLAMILGDEGAQRIKITKEMAMEDFRVFIERSASEAQTTQIANELIFSLVQMQMLSAESAADLFNRSTPEDIARRMRQDMNMKQIAQDNMAEQQMMAQQQLAEAQLEDVQASKVDERRQEIRADEQAEKDRQHEIDQIVARGEMQMAKDNNREDNKNVEKLTEQIKRNI